MMNRKKLFLCAACAALSAAILCGCQSTAAEPAPAAEETAVAEETVAAEESVLSPAAVIEDIYTVQAFTDEAVADADVQSIVMAGINAPSAMNSQPWHFTVITDKDVMQQIADEMGGGFGPPPGFTAPGAPTDTEAAEEDAASPADASDADEDTPAEAPAGVTPGPAPAANGVKADIASAPLLIVISCREGSELDAGLATQNMSAEAFLLGYGTKILASPNIVLNGDKQEEYKELLGIPEDMAVSCVLLVGRIDTELYDAASSATVRNAPEEVATYIQ